MSVKKVLMAGGVTVATLGLSTCDDNGAVDPAPEPLNCATVGAGQSLSATATVAGTALSVSISNNASASWQSLPTVTGVSGATVQNVSFDANNPNIVVVDLTLDAPTTTSGSFTLAGTLEGFGGELCAVQRTFTFTINNGAVEVALQRWKLPLGGGERAAIVMRGRDGRDVDLSAAGASAGGRVSWAVTGGALDHRGGDRVTWKLPSEPGLYQVELVIDRGREGLSLDTLTLEVT